MSSPFSKKFHGKNPLTPLQGNAFIKAKMDAEAAGKDTFVVDGKSHPVQMKGSPTYAHAEKFRKKAMKLSEGVEQGDYDYENPEVTKLLDKAKQADADHARDRAKEQGATPKKKKEGGKPMKKSNAPTEMSAIKKKTAPLNASYANPQDYFYVSNADDFQNLFDNISSNTAKVIDAQNDPEKQADRLQRRIDKRNERAKGDTKKGAGSEFDKLTQKLVDRQSDAAERATKAAKDPCKNKTKGTQTYDSYGNAIIC